MRHRNLHSNVNQKFRSQSHPPRPATKSQLPHQRNSTRSATDEVGDELQKSASSKQDKLAGGKQDVCKQRVAASFCAQETTSAEKRFMKQLQRLGDDFKFAFSCNAPPAWKFCKSVSTAKVLKERIKRNDDERLPRLLVKNHGAATKNDAAARNNDGATKNTRLQEETTGPPADARPLGHRSCGGAPPRPRPTRGHEGLTQKARKFSVRNICPNLDSRSKTDLETQRTEKSFQSTRRLSTKRAPGRNRARDHPLQRRTRDHRATSPAAGPRRARGSAAAKRARPRKRASLARSKICDFGPEL